MAKYYNVTRGPLAASLSGGRSVTIPPKSWFEIAGGDEGSAGVSALVRKGYLKRSTLPIESESTPVVPVVVPVVATILPELVVDLDLGIKNEAKAIEAKAEAKKK